MRSRRSTPTRVLSAGPGAAVEFLRVTDRRRLTSQRLFAMEDVDSLRSVAAEFLSDRTKDLKWTARTS